MLTEHFFLETKYDTVQITNNQLNRDSIKNLVIYYQLSTNRAHNLRYMLIIRTSFFVVVYYDAHKF